MTITLERQKVLDKVSNKTVNLVSTAVLKVERVFLDLGCNAEQSKRFAIDALRQCADIYEKLPFEHNH